MDIIGDRRFVEVPGGKTHELPPLLVKTAPDLRRTERMMEIASDIIEQEDILPMNEMMLDEGARQRRSLDLALNLVEQYFELLSHWQWGDAVVEWIRQCEQTFGARLELRNLLRNDLWPHAGRSSFVTLLEDKSINTDGVQLEKAVGLRLAFRQLPPIRCCTDQFLFYLNDSVAESAYRGWLNTTPNPICSLPPERFEFQVVNMSVAIH